MSKEEIIEKIRVKTEDYTFSSDTDSYIRGYLDALCQTYEITWEERCKIEEALKNE